MVWIECDDAVFKCHFKKVHKNFIIINSRKNINSASKVVNWIIVDILKYMYLYYPCAQASRVM